MLGTFLFVFFWSFRKYKGSSFFFSLPTQTLSLAWDHLLLDSAHFVFLFPQRPALPISLGWPTNLQMTAHQQRLPSLSCFSDRLGPCGRTCRLLSLLIPARTRNESHPIPSLYFGERYSWARCFKQPIATNKIQNLKILNLDSWHYETLQQVAS